MFESYLFQTIQKRNRLTIRSYRRYGEHGGKMLAFLGLCYKAYTMGRIKRGDFFPNIAPK